MHQATVDTLLTQLEPATSPDAASALIAKARDRLAGLLSGIERIAATRLL